MSKFVIADRYIHKFNGFDFTIIISDPDPERPSEIMWINKDVKKFSCFFRTKQGKWMRTGFITYEFLHEENWMNFICDITFKAYKKKNYL